MTLPADVSIICRRCGYPGEPASDGSESFECPECDAILYASE